MLGDGDGGRLIDSCFGSATVKVDGSGHRWRGGVRFGSGLDLLQRQFENFDDLIGVASDGRSRSSAVLETNLGDEHASCSIMQRNPKGFFELRCAITATISGNYCAGNGHDEAADVKTGGLYFPASEKTSQMIHDPRPTMGGCAFSVWSLQRHAVDPVTNPDGPSADFPRSEICPLQTSESVTLFSWQILRVYFRNFADSLRHFRIAAGAVEFPTHFGHAFSSFT